MGLESLTEKQPFLATACCVCIHCNTLSWPVLSMVMSYLGCIAKAVETLAINILCSVRLPMQLLLERDAGTEKYL